MFDRYWYMYYQEGTKGSERAKCNAKENSCCNKILAFMGERQYFRRCTQDRNSGNGKAPYCSKYFSIPISEICLGSLSLYVISIITENGVSPTHYINDSVIHCRWLLLSRW